MSDRNLLRCLLLAILACSSCGSYKHRYLQVSKNVQQEAVYGKLLEEHRLQPNDILYVNVVTAVEEYAGMFSATQAHQQMTATMSASSMYFTHYPVDVAGNVKMPLIGNVYVAGLTVPEAEKLIFEKVSEIVYDVQVVVRLAGFRINVVGEVKNPGEYTVYRDHATVMEALSLAGDMNYYGNRREIMIVRNTQDSFVTHLIDLTDRNMLSSPLFYLHPGDLVYVQPLPRTIFRVNISDIVTYLSAISSSLALVVAIVSLTKK